MTDFLIKKMALWFRKYAQGQNNVTVDRILGAARKIMKSQKYCIVNTSEGGDVYSRVLQPFHPDAEFLVRFGTSPNSRKIQQILKNPRGSISYLDNKKEAGVNLIGQFEISKDIAHRKKYFVKSWWAFFPEGPEGDDFIVLTFKPNRIEVWDASRGLTPEPFGLKSAAAVRLEDSFWELPFEK